MVHQYLKCLGVAAVIISAPFSQAAYIDGAILFSSFDWGRSGGNLGVSGPQIVAQVDDLSGQTAVAFTDFQYLPFVAQDVVWESDDYRFSISSLSIIDESSDGLELDGVGLLADKNGVLDDTYATWGFSGGVINWSLSTIATGFGPRPSEVPLPAAAWLFGTALMGMVGTRRQKH